MRRGLRLAACVAAWVGFGCAATAFGLEVESAAHERLLHAARGLATGVVLVGNPDVGQGWAGHGSALILSREHRLLATNAHVAATLQTAPLQLALLNGATYGDRWRYRVE